MGNVDNTSDTNKPVSTAQQTAINTAISNLDTAIKKYISDGEYTNKDYVDGEITKLYNLLMGDGVPDGVIDTIKEIVGILESDETGLTAIVQKIKQNADDIDDLERRTLALENAVVTPVKKTFTEGGSWSQDTTNGTFTISVVVDATVNGNAHIQRKIGDVYRTSDNKAVFVQVQERNNGTNNVVEITSNSKFSGYFYVL